MNFEELRNRTVGTVEFVSSREIKILLETNAPQSTAINTGVPQSFPKVNGYVLIPCENGAIIGLITWIGVEYSNYPKRQGLKDFDLVDLPFPLRHLSVCPIGVLKQNSDYNYSVERGVFSYPCIGDTAAIPSSEQLKAIVKNDDGNAKIKIGISPMAANQEIYVNPDKLFGRHLAVLGNTGSGKSCSVAGLIRWSIEAARNSIKDDKKVNARFLILDPNDEYNSCFDDLGKVRKYKVIINDKERGDISKLKIPSWMWNSYEWSAITKASDKSQRPLLRKALRDIRTSSSENDDLILLRRYYSSVLIEIKNDLAVGISRYGNKDGRSAFGGMIKSIISTIKNDISNLSDECAYKNKLNEVLNCFSEVETKHHKQFFTKEQERIEYYDSFEKMDLENIIIILTNFLDSVGGIEIYDGTDIDAPSFFKNEDLVNHIERLSSSNPYMDYFLMRLRTLVSDIRISSVIDVKDDDYSLKDWLNQYIGSQEDNGTVNIIDLSLIPSDILFIVVSVFARLTFEAHQRYRRINGDILPTTLVIEEAHNFIKKYSDSIDEISATQLCTQAFEKIAKEGRKFGLGLVLSSQRPSELSATVLSQCNTFLLHRLVNDKDQEMVKKLVPDSMGGILNELPVLPTKKAILLGWAAPIPTLVEMNGLKPKNRPKSNDPDFWDVWIGKKEREINWESICEEWQQTTKQ